jgi:hypothetical protein
VQQHFGIGTADERVAERFEVLAQLQIVVDLPV